MSQQVGWARDVDEALALWQLVGSPTILSGDERPTGEEQR